MPGGILLVVALAGRSLRASFCCGLVFGLALFVPLLSWLINVAWYAWASLAAWDRSNPGCQNPPWMTATVAPRAAREGSRTSYTWAGSSP